MTVAILGAGNVGQALATRLLAAGETVRFGSRAPEGTVTLASGAAVADVSMVEAARGAGIVLLCVPAAAAAEALRAAAPADGTLVVDCTNPLRWENGPVHTPPAEGSQTAALAAAFPRLRVVKAFNHFGAEIQADPQMRGGAADAWVAGDDAAGRAEVVALATRMGFRGVDVGPLRNAANLEAMAVLWIHLATVGGQGRQFAFRADGRP